MRAEKRVVIEFILSLATEREREREREREKCCTKVLLMRVKFFVHVPLFKLFFSIIKF